MTVRTRPIPRVQQFHRFNWLAHWNEFEPTIDTYDALRLCDGHAHLRDGAAREKIAPFHSPWAEVVVDMPNKNPKLVTGEMAVESALETQRVLRAARARPYRVMRVIYLTEETLGTTIERASALGVEAAKLYIGITTGSSHGISDIRRMEDVFRAMEEVGMVLCVHATVPEPTATCYNTEAKCRKWVRWLAENFPRLRIVIEHVTTRSMGELVLSLPDNVIATLTAHHLFLRFQDVISGKMQPDHFCIPTANVYQNRTKLIEWATSRDPRIRKKFVLGTDSAPHLPGAKYCEACCAGIFTAPVAPQLLIALYERLDCLDVLPIFTARRFCEFWGIAHSGETIRYVRRRNQVPLLCNGYRPFIPFWADGWLDWELEAA